MLMWIMCFLLMSVNVLTNNVADEDFDPVIDFLLNGKSDSDKNVTGMRCKGGRGEGGEGGERGTGDGYDVTFLILDAKRCSPRGRNDIQQRSSQRFRGEGMNS